MGDLGKVLEGMNFDSEEELSEFLYSSMTGKTLTEITAELDKMRSEEPETPLETANRVLEELTLDATYEEMIARANEALEISADCVVALVILGNCEQSEEKAVAHYETAVKLGRELHADRITAVGESSPGLWISYDAQNFLVAMERLADAVDGADAVERRFELLQEIIRLNPSDNLGIRAKLLAEYFVDGRLEDVRFLLDRFPGDVLTAMVGGPCSPCWKPSRRPITGCRSSISPIPGFSSCSGSGFPALSGARSRCLRRR